MNDLEQYIWIGDKTRGLWWRLLHAVSVDLMRLGP